MNDREGAQDHVVGPDRSGVPADRRRMVRFGAHRRRDEHRRRLDLGGPRPDLQAPARDRQRAQGPDAARRDRRRRVHRGGRGPRRRGQAAAGPGGRVRPGARGDVARGQHAVAGDPTTLGSGTTVRTLAKNSPARSTGALVSIIGHITVDELRRELTDTAKANGFANRFLFMCVRRSKALPFGGRLTDAELRELADGFARGSRSPRSVAGSLDWGEAAAELWERVYRELSEGREGMFGAVVGRGETHVLRFAVIYALLDASRVIRREHLEAALAVVGLRRALRGLHIRRAHRRRARGSAVRRYPRCRRRRHRPWRATARRGQPQDPDGAL